VGVDKQMTLMVVVMVHTLSKKKTLTLCEGFFYGYVVDIKLFYGYFYSKQYQLCQKLKIY